MSKVMISLPGKFLRDMDALAKTEQRSRSELVREAVRAYVTIRIGSRQAGRHADVHRAASRILKSRLHWPEGETAESLVRRSRERRYGAGWKTS